MFFTLVTRNPQKRALGSTLLVQNPMVKLELLCSKESLIKCVPLPRSYWFIWTRIDDYLLWLISNQSMASLASQNGPTVASKAMSTADSTASTMSLEMRGWELVARWNGWWNLACSLWVTRLCKKWEGGREGRKRWKAKQGREREKEGRKRRRDEDILSHLEPSSSHCKSPIAPAVI